MYQGSSLQGLAWFFLGQLAGSEFPQLVIDQWQQLFGRLAVAVFNRGEDTGNIGHG